MKKTDYPLTKKEFDYIYSKVPRLTVEIIIKSDKGVLLTLRTIEPCRNMWHLPGGTIYYGESITDTVKRVAAKELSIKVRKSRQIGIIEYPDHVASGYGDPRGIAFLIEDYTGDILLDIEASDYDWFDTLPKLMHPNQGSFLIEKKLIKQ